MYYVYVLKNEIYDKLHIGYTNDVSRGILGYVSGKPMYAKISDKWLIIYLEGYVSQGDVIDRERNLKSYGRVYSKLKIITRRSLSSEKVRGQRLRPIFD